MVIHGGPDDFVGTPALMFHEVEHGRVKEGNVFHVKFGNARRGSCPSRNGAHKGNYEGIVHHGGGQGETIMAIQFQPGIAYSLNNQYSFRIGNSRGILLCGGGFSFGDFQLDLSYHNSHHFSIVDERATISVSYFFGEIDRTKNKNLIEKSVSTKDEKLIKKLLQYRDRDRFQRNMDKGKYLYEKGRYNEAQISFQAALAIYPESRSAQMWLERTRVKLKAGSYNE